MFFMSLRGAFFCDEAISSYEEIASLPLVARNDIVGVIARRSVPKQSRGNREIASADKVHPPRNDNALAMTGGYELWMREHIAFTS
jgi:hypothetical protein